MTRVDLRVATVAWAEAQEAIRAIHETVFIREQGVPVELERDGLDPACVHVPVKDERGTPIGTARLTTDGQIGRMAGLKEWRGREVGRVLLLALLKEAHRRGMSWIVLAAQTHGSASMKIRVSGDRRAVPGYRDSPSHDGLRSIGSPAG
jgi:predicted GNAT family N-acyltransferase